MLLLSYLVTGALFLWLFFRTGKKPKNWHALVASTLFAPLTMLWLVFEFISWALTNSVTWLNKEV